MTLPALLSPEQNRTALRIVLGLFLVCCATQALAEQNLPESIAEALRRADIPVAAASFFVQKVGAGGAREIGAPLVSVNAESAMNPASTMKLVTTYVALELLGPSFTWKTVAAAVGPVTGEVLHGDLFLKGSGDPKLVFEDFWLLLRGIRARGVREIRGDLVLDHSLFEAAVPDRGRFDGEPLKPYNVEPDALLVNYKAVTLTFVPDPERLAVRVFAEPPLAGMRLGKLAASLGACGDWKKRIGADFDDVKNIRFTGSYPIACGEQSWSVSLLDHAQFVGALFRRLWSEMGGTLRGEVRDGTLPPEAATIAVHESPSLAEIVRFINKYSNNVMARQLYLDLAAESLGVPANPGLAAGVVRNFLGARGLSMPELVIENGSGLSRVERISAHSMARLLLAAWDSPVMPEFVSSLSLVAADGTMKKRLAASGVSGRAHIKTGSLTGARAIAGYVLAASGARYVVVSFVNHGNAEAAREAQDALLQWVFERG